MVVGARTTSPIGHHLFCIDQPADCQADTPNAADPVAITEPLLGLVAEINLSINKVIRPSSDFELYGVEERWTYPIEAGDCEDYALLKLRSLRAIGIAKSDLLMTVVRKRNGEGHAVLTLRTTRGDYVLDNLSSQVKLWRDTPYTFVKRQDPTAPQHWVAIEDGADLVVGSLKK
ncbi:MULTISPECIES: transglutaminase-like cysteine peptidase [unclassified Aureimonas]|uniref:transglutaminase-like cysteine peptidase n=1 Tax=unclassified Aureimonas TaxID=2615206 RepID=UPI001FCDDFCF|nr:MULTISPECIES: transglutaminase-like cysteine peptidase [unclassified Aureimonas]